MSNLKLSIMRILAWKPSQRNQCGSNGEEAFSLSHDKDFDTWLIVKDKEKLSVSIFIRTFSTTTFKISKLLNCRNAASRLSKVNLHDKDQSKNLILKINILFWKFWDPTAQIPLDFAFQADYSFWNSRTKEWIFPYACCHSLEWYGLKSTPC